MQPWRLKRSFNLLLRRPSSWFGAAIEASQFTFSQFLIGFIRVRPQSQLYKSNHNTRGLQSFLCYCYFTVCVIRNWMMSNLVPSPSVRTRMPFPVFLCDHLIVAPSPLFPTNGSSFTALLILSAATIIQSATASVPSCFSPLGFSMSSSVHFL